MDPRDKPEEDKVLGQHCCCVEGSDEQHLPALHRRQKIDFRALAQRLLPGAAIDLAIDGDGYAFGEYRPERGIGLTEPREHFLDGRGFYHEFGLSAGRRLQRAAEFDDKGRFRGCGGQCDAPLSMLPISVVPLEIEDHFELDGMSRNCRRCLQLNSGGQISKSTANSSRNRS